MLIRSFCRLTIILGLCFNQSCVELQQAPTISSVSPEEGTIALSEIRKELLGYQHCPPPPATPIYVPLRRLPDSTSAHPNVKTARSPKRVEVSADLPQVIPGKDGVLMPEIIPASVETLWVEQAELKPSLPLRIRQTATYALQYLNVDQGMLSAYVRYLLKDSKGYLWISTSSGISRYDGNNFLHFTTEKGLPNGTGLTMLEDRQGRLWFGMKNGVSCFDGLHFVQYLKGEGPINAIAEDPEGGLWFGGDGGLFHFLPGREPAIFTHYTKKEGLLDNLVKTMLVDRRGQLWIGTPAGVSSFNGTGFTHLTTSEGLTDNRVSSLAEDDRGQIWIGTESGLNGYRPSNQEGTSGGTLTNYTTREGLIGNNIKYILIDSKDQVWLATNRGLCCYNGTQFIHYGTEEGLNTLNIRTLVEDNRGHLWLGTGGGGISRLDLRSFRHFFPHERLINNGVMALAKAKEEKVWFGTGKGAVLYNDSTYFYFTPREGLIHLEVLAILEDSRGNIWLGTPGGVSRYDGKGFTQYTSREGLADGEVNTIIEDSRGKMWIGTDKGLSCFDPDAEGRCFTNYYAEGGLISSNVRTLFEDSKQNIWVCTREGLSRCAPYLDPDGNVRYYVHHFLEGIDVRTVLEDRSGRLWFGTVGDGLYRYEPFDEHYQQTQLTTRHGLSSNTVWSLLEDKRGNIWMSTEMGITMMQFLSDTSTFAVDQLSGQVSGAQFFTFYKEQGLSKLDFQTNSACLDDQNRIWWGSVGASRLDLDRFKLPTDPPAVVELNQIDINQHQVDYRRLDQAEYRQTLPLAAHLPESFPPVVRFANYPEWMSLPYELNHLTFHFAAIDWSSTQKIRYQYYLDGLEQEWSVPSAQAKVDYRNLPPGSYTFKLRAGGAGARWTPPFSYDFVIRSPWWKTGWAYLVYSLLLLGLAYTIFSFFRKRLLLQHALEMQHEEANRLKELDVLKSRFFTNVNHELRTPLSLIMGPVKTLQKDDQLTDKQHRLLQMAYRSGRQLEDLINEILDLRKLEEGFMKLDLKPTQLPTFFNRYFTQFESLADRKAIDFEYDISLPHNTVGEIDREKCRQILYNLLSNAFKFTTSGGQIRARVLHRNDCLQIEVSDTGTGIHPDDLPNLFDRYFQTNRPEQTAGGGTGIGLALCREYATLFGGEIKVESVWGQGAVFSVLFPLLISSIQSASQSKYPSAKHRSQPKAEPTTSTDSGTPRPIVLVVEDNPDLQEYLQLILSPKYQVITVDNGQEAWQLLTARSFEKADNNPSSPGLDQLPSLILSDLMMPVMDGYQLLEKLKSEATTRHIPIIMLTARADSQDRLKALRIGVDDYLTKPFDEAELQVRIANLLRNQSIRKREKLIDGIEKNDQPVLSTADQEWLASFETHVRENLSKSVLSVPALAHTFAMSESTLLRQLKRLTGLTPVQYLQQMRLELARQLLEAQTYRTVAQVANKVGYENAKSFSRNFKKRFGKLPSGFLD